VSRAERISATRTIAAPAAAIWAVISHPAGHVAIDGSGMLMSAPDAQALQSVGEEFTIFMDREALGDLPLGRYTVVNTVTRYEPEALLEWSVAGVSFPAIGHVYGYLLEPADDGATVVTSYCDWSAVQEKWKSRVTWPVVPQTALRASLGILDRIVLAGGLSPG
jgi:hypothetical protein